MVVAEVSKTNDDFLKHTLGVISKVFDSVSLELKQTGDRENLEKLKKQYVPGKMLRSRLGMALSRTSDHHRNEIIHACAATELIHSATLFHDDVIDGASLRRRQPSLWQEVGQTGAILIGDLFYSSALQIVVENGNLRGVSSFVSKVREVCATEMVHELVYRGKPIDVQTCVNVARGKTGPLFAFISEMCGGSDKRKSDALREVGYKVGTAYQIADDLIDVLGNETLLGKTLGTDRTRKKFTIAQNRDYSESFIRGLVQSLCEDALKLTYEWPELTESLENYMISDLFPSWDIQFDFVEHAVVNEV